MEREILSGNKRKEEKEEKGIGFSIQQSVGMIPLSTI